MENSDNHNMSFQSIFSWISTLNNIILIYYGDWRPSYHLHINCSSCVQPVNEEMVDTPEEEAQIVEELFANIPRNEYTFIPLEEYVGLNMIPKLDLVFDPPADSLQNLLCDSVSSWIISQGCTKLELRYNWSKLEAPQILPVSTAMRLPMLKFILRLVSQICWKSLQFKMIHSKTLTNDQWMRLKNQVRQEVFCYPLSWFYSLQTIYLNDETIPLFEMCPTIPSYPLGTPPTREEYASASKGLICGYLSGLSLTDVRDWAYSLFQTGIPEVSDPALHPLVLNLGICILSGHKSWQLTEILKTLWTKILPSRPANFTTASDLHPLLENHRRLLQIPEVANVFANPLRIVGCSIDCLTKMMGNRKRPLPLENPGKRKPEYVITPSKVKKLPVGCTIFPCYTGPISSAQYKFNRTDFIGKIGHRNLL